MKMNHWKRSAVVLLALVLLFSSCSKETGITETDMTTEVAFEVETPPETILETEHEEVDEQAVLDNYNALVGHVLTDEYFLPCNVNEEAANELRSIPNVVAVGKLDVFEDNEYMLFFETPTDHADPSKGTFIQRMHVYYEGKDAPNCFYIGGYDLNMIAIPESREVNAELVCKTFFAEKYGCNYFEPEYRFYGRSKPEGINENDTEFWELLTVEQASDDFHLMIEGIKKVFSGKWCIEGMSKGGEMVAYHTGRHPEDGDMFLAEATMILLGEGDTDLYEFAYNEAGDLVLGEAKAEEFRNRITEFQIECLRNREELAPMLWDEAQNTACTFSTDINMDILFDCTVLDQVYFWQYSAPDSTLDRIDSALNLKNANREVYLDALLDALVDGYGPWQYELYQLNDYEDGMYYYLFESFREDGHYGYDFSYLREAIEGSGSDVKLYVTEDMEKDLWERRIAAEHREKFPYDPTVLKARIKAVDTTDENLFIINGLSDIFQTHEVKESDNPNVRIFNIPNVSHAESTPEYLSEEQLAEFDSLVRDIMEIG